MYFLHLVAHDLMVLLGHDHCLYFLYCKSGTFKCEHIIQILICFFTSKVYFHIFRYLMLL